MYSHKLSFTLGMPPRAKVVILKMPPTYLHDPSCPRPIPPYAFRKVSRRYFVIIEMAILTTSK